MTDLFAVFIAACLANNLVLDYLLGVSPVIAVSRTIRTAADLSLVMFLVLPVTTLCGYVVDTYILRPLQLEYLQLPGFVIIITLVTLSMEKIPGIITPALREKITVFIPLLLVNTILIGVALLSIRQNQGLITALVFAMGSAAGFAVVVIIFSALRQRIAAADVPQAFQGAAILIITLGILSMAFMGFSGPG